MTQFFQKWIICTYAFIFWLYLINKLYSCLHLFKIYDFNGNISSYNPELNNSRMTKQEQIDDDLNYKLHMTKRHEYNFDKDHDFTHCSIKVFNKIQTYLKQNEYVIQKMYESESVIPSIYNVCYITNFGNLLCSVYKNKQVGKVYVFECNNNEKMHLNNIDTLVYLQIDADNITDLIKELQLKIVGLNIDMSYLFEQIKINTNINTYTDNDSPMFVDNDLRPVRSL
jgi:hypothetical protein